MEQRKQLRKRERERYIIIRKRMRAPMLDEKEGETEK